MRRVSLLFLYVSLALADDYPFWEFRLTSDASQRYMVNVQMATGPAAQHFTFALTTSTPFVTVAGADCGTCGDVNSYNQQGSTTFQALGNSANLSLVGGVTTSGPLIQEDCALRAENGSSWEYPKQTIIMSNQSSQLYGGQVSGVFGLASGRATDNVNVSVIGGIFGRNPTMQSVTIGLALRPPNPKGSDNAGTMHLFGTDTDSYTGDITWKVTTVTPNSTVSTFEIDGWQFKAGDNTVTNNNQDLPSIVDPYYTNMFFPSQEAHLIHARVKGSSSKPASDGQSTVYVVPCNAKFSLAVIVGGETWQVDQKLLVQKQDDGTCVSNIQGWADADNTHYQFGSAFLSSLYLVIQALNPNGSQTDRIGFARRGYPPSIVGPIVGGVVGGVGGIAIVTLVIIFWVRRYDQKKLKDLLDFEDRAGNVGRFEEHKHIQPFPFTVQLTDIRPVSPIALPYASPVRPPVAPRFIQGASRSPDIDDPLLPPSYDQMYPTGPNNPPRRQRPNLSPRHARKN